MKTRDMTVIICCAGMGTRLGISTTKSLLDICGKPLIIHQLEQLSNFDDIRIVIGYQAEKMIETVIQYRKDIMFAFNHEYETTGPAASIGKALIRARENVIILDGDILFHPTDFSAFLEYPEECLAFSNIKSDEPVLMKMENELVVEFSISEGCYEWPGIAKLKRDRFCKANSYIYKMIETHLPLKGIYVRTRDIDTPDDYDNAVKWALNNYVD